MFVPSSPVQKGRAICHGEPSVPKAAQRDGLSIFLLPIGSDWLSEECGKELLAGAGAEDQAKETEAGQNSNKNDMQRHNGRVKLDGLSEGLPRQPGQQPFTI